MNHRSKKSKQPTQPPADRPAAVHQDMEDYAVENLGLDDDSNQFAEEVFEEYEQMRAEVERSASRADREGW